MTASPWTTGFSLLVLLSGGLVVPNVAFAQHQDSQIAQLFPSSGRPGQLPDSIPRVTIAQGVVIPTEYEDAEKILMTKEETVPLTLTVSANIRDRNSRLLIPYGSQIKGELRPELEDSDLEESNREDSETEETEETPTPQGVRFIAQELVLEDRTIPIDGSSELITRTEMIDEGTDTNAVLKGAAIGAAAAAVIGAITGDVDFIEVLGGAGAGALGGLITGRKKVELFSIDPDTDLDVILRSSLDL
ncbi:hypothetical protein PN462_04625 [Spirulina sp. CS-785/01]|uniref:hypothetical protein n=1 Tax=Spirulina sp. CS-785/01 TaxID=3021716 RepID=UPI0023310D8B|nr:hypothetical protein [Spirulina sp. CS-785/01]MDB9312379.1 hypothetical protein [Spirulina sp. CS-785/01]